MKKLFLLTPILILTSLLSLPAQARCGYYAGHGYRCFGNEGGTGGRVFKEMDANTKNVVILMLAVKVKVASAKE